MRKETAIIAIPFLAAGFALLQGRGRLVPVLKVTEVDGSTSVVRTHQILLIRPSRSTMVTSSKHHQYLSTFWIVGQDNDLDVRQTLDQFRPFIEGFIELHIENGPVFVNPLRVTRVRSSGLLSGASPEEMRPTTEITFEGGRKITVCETPKVAASALGRAA